MPNQSATSEKNSFTIHTLSVDFHHSIRDVLVTHLLMGWDELEQQFTVLREESIQVCVQYEVFDLGGGVANASLCNHCMQEGTMENDG